MSSRIGNVLVKTNVLNPEQLEQALEAQKSSGNSLFDTVIQLGFASEQDYLQSLSKHFSTPIIELDSVTLEASAIALIPADLAKKHCLVPIVQENSTLQVAMSDPSNLVALNEIKFFTGLDIKVSIASESKIRSQYQKYYEQVGKQENDELLDSPDESLMELFKPQEPKSAETPTTSELTQHNEPTDDAPLIQLVNAILVKALKQNASAIYFEPFEKSFRVRFRIDSNLQEIMSTPANLEFPVTSRIKFMANLDIEERDLPQNGRLTLKMARGSERLVRVSTAPTLFGEKLVLRILEKANRPLKLAKLGLNEHQSEQLTQSLSKSEGMILVAGPANSGKSTTLYAAISALNQAQKDIATIEDFVEFPIEGINQTQLSNEEGLSFSTALQAFLRQNPDVIMIGEIPDFDIAEKAFNAALSGPLVLSSLYARDSISTLARLQSMGVSPSILTSSLNAIVAQRLLNKICPACIETQVTPDHETLRRLGVHDEEIQQLNLKHGKGCEQCNQTGYRGKVALFEILVMSDALKEALLQGHSINQLQAIATQEGMTTLRSAALNKVKEGVTTVDELLRTTTGD